jgi:hypothetical protein
MTVTRGGAPLPSWGLIDSLAGTGTDEYLWGTGEHESRGQSHSMLRTRAYPWAASHRNQLARDCLARKPLH